jgi:hypothetical protein
MKICSIEGCGKPLRARGWCSTHWARWRTHGDPNTITNTRHTPLLDRYWMKVRKTPGCWNWEGASSGGYGSFAEGHKKKHHKAHRFSYELLVGPIPEGMDLDHRCFNTLCVNPDHLRPTTRKQNAEHQPGAQRNSKTGVLGVHRVKNRFFVGVGHNGQKHYGGCYKTLEEAAEAARQLRIELHTHNDLDRISA